MEDKVKDSIEASDADSAKYTDEQEQKAQDELDEFIKAQSEDEGLVDQRPLDETSMSDDELDALKTQDDIASSDYEPVSFDENVQQFETDSEFALSADSPEFSGPDAHAEAVRTGVNPRTVATSSNPDGEVRFESDGSFRDSRGTYRPEAFKTDEDK